MDYNTSHDHLHVTRASVKAWWVIMSGVRSGAARELGMINSNMKTEQ